MADFRDAVIIPGIGPRWPRDGNLTALSKALLIVCVLALPVLAMRRTSLIAPATAQVQFTIDHQLFTKIVNGSFTNFRGQITFDPDRPEASQVRWRVETASIETGSKARDKRLRSAEYLDAPRFPSIRFISQTVKSTGPDQLLVTGNFTLCAVTKVIDVPVKLVNGVFDCKFHIKRTDYGMLPDTLLAADDLAIHLQVQQYASERPSWRRTGMAPSE